MQTAANPYWMQQIAYIYPLCRKLFEFHQCSGLGNTKWSPYFSQAWSIARKSFDLGNQNWELYRSYFLSLHQVWDWFVRLKLFHFRQSAKLRSTFQMHFCMSNQLGECWSNASSHRCGKRFLYLKPCHRSCLQWLKYSVHSCNCIRAAFGASTLTILQIVRCPTLWRIMHSLWSKLLLLTFALIDWYKQSQNFCC